MKKPTRVAGIIETPYGVLLAQDRKDKYVRESIEAIKATRHKTTEQIEQAIQILMDGRFCLPGGKIEQGEEPEETLMRELNEELGVDVEAHHIVKIMEIVGNTRNHLIYLVKASGVVMLAERELTGVGLLKPRNIMPMNHDFFQTHVIKVYERYMKNGQRTTLLPGFVSSLYFHRDLVEDWFRDEQRAYLYRSHKSLRARNIPAPSFPVSLPNFTYLDPELRPQSPQVRVNLTRASNAQIIPPEKQPEQVPPSDKKPVTERKKSNPRMQAISCGQPAEENSPLLDSQCASSESDEQCVYSPSSQDSDQDKKAASK